MNELVKAFGERVKLIRLEKGLGLREAARKMAIDPSYLSRIEKSHLVNLPSKDVQLRMERTYGIIDIYQPTPGEMAIKKVAELDAYIQNLLKEIYVLKSEIETWKKAHAEQT